MKAKLQVAFAMLIFGSLGVFVTNIPLPSKHIVFVRAALGCIILFVWTVIKKKFNDKIPVKSFLLLLLLGALIGINWVLLFESYKYVSVSIATLVYYLQPVIMIVFSVLFFREKLTKIKIFAVAAACIGMVLINGTGITGADPGRGLILSFAAAILYAVIIIINNISKSLSGIHGLPLTAIQMLGAAIVAGIYTFSDYNNEFSGLTIKTICLLASLGIIHTALAYYLYFKNIKKLDVQSLAVLGYADPVSALFFSAIFLGEKLALVQIAGAVLILGGAMISELKKQ